MKHQKTFTNLLGLLAFTLSMSSSSFAFAGNESGGGDLCENRIQVIRDDMKSLSK